MIGKRREGIEEEEQKEREGRGEYSIIYNNIIVYNIIVYNNSVCIIIYNNSI
jgi:hypothetical protein